MWLVPALLLLPLYLLIVLISMAAEEGAILGATMKLRGGVHSALGVLLLTTAIVVAVFTVQHATVADDWIQGTFFTLVIGGVGTYFVRRELRKLADEAG